MLSRYDEGVSFGYRERVKQRRRALRPGQDPISGDVSPAMGKEESGSIAVAYPISGDALRAGDAKTPSPDAEGKVRLRDPGLGVERCLAVQKTILRASAEAEKSKTCPVSVMYFARLIVPPGFVGSMTVSPSP